MKINKKVLGLIVLGGLTVSGNGWSATASAVDLANSCAGCHGVDGSSVGPATPSLAGISVDYFKDAMANYKDPEGRYSTIMSRIAKGYSDKEIELMADYFSKQKMVHTAQTFDAEKAKAGANLHKKYCEKCHEDGGRSSEDDAGILAGQWMEYLQFTMDDFQNERREMPKKMKKRVQKLEIKKGAEGIDQLIHFYGSQK